MARGAAKRYAEAIFSLAKERGTLDPWADDLTRLDALMHDSQAEGFFANPNVPRDEKLRVLDEALAEGQPEARNLAHILVDNDRVTEIPEIVRLYNEALLADRGIAIAHVTTAEPLQPAEQDAVKAQLNRIVGKEIELRLQTDPSIIGGVVARVGDMLIDGSVINQLRRLRARLAAA